MVGPPLIQYDYVKRYVNGVLVSDTITPGSEVYASESGSSKEPSGNLAAREIARSWEEPGVKGKVNQKSVPTKITFFGDFPECAKVLPEARLMVQRLLTMIKLSRGRIKQAWAHPQAMPNGQTIAAGVSFNTSFIEIRAAKKAYKTGSESKVIPKYEECYCSCNIAYGVIIARKTSKLDGWIPMYDVEACYKQEEYVLYENILASDFTPYSAGQAVVVMAYHDFQYGCCALGEDFADGIATSCQPIIDTRGISDELWRTTYRILPICANALEEWTEFNMAPKRTAINADM